MASGSDGERLITAQIRALEERTALLKAWVQARIGDQGRRTDAAIDSQKRRDKLSRDELYWRVLIALALIAPLHSLT